MYVLKPFVVCIGFMTQTEKQMFLSIPNCDFNTYWVPCTWFIHVLQEIKAENPNIDPIGVKLIMEVRVWSSNIPY